MELGTNSQDQESCHFDGSRKRDNLETVANDTTVVDCCDEDSLRRFGKEPDSRCCRQSCDW